MFIFADPRHIRESGDTSGEVLKMSKKRPGVEAAVRLAASLDITIWENVEAQLDEVVSSIKNLDKWNVAFRDLGIKFQNLNQEGSSYCSISKKELLDIIEWKFAVGKPRRALMKHLNSNSENNVKQCSSQAIAKARCITPQNGDILETAAASPVALQEAIEDLLELKGVGPATASAILTLVRPDIFCFMYDEVIDCFQPKRTYTLPVYLAVNAECLKISKSLPGWNASRVAQALWIAARVCASGGQDQTTGTKHSASKMDGNEAKRVSKRRRKV